MLPFLPYLLLNGARCLLWLSELGSFPLGSPKRCQEMGSSRLIVLGAGASIGGCLYPKSGSWQESLNRMPSTDNFFYDVSRLEATPYREERWVNQLAMTYTGLYKFITHAWGIDDTADGFDPDAWKGISVERVFSFLDVGERTYNSGTAFHKAFSALKEDLEDFICWMIGIRSADKHCEFLLDAINNLSEMDTIISFNWDTIADKTLHIRDLPQFSSYANMLRGQKFNVQQAAKEGQFLKLHGSLNWIACRNSSCRLHRQPAIPFDADSNMPPAFDDVKRFEKCPECEAERPRRMIVPPTSQKLIRKGSFLHRLWLIAMHTLPRISTAIFIGYSFPDTDFYAEWLFRLFQFVEGPNPRIVVVNPEMSNESSRTWQKYHSVFQGCEITAFETLKDFSKAAWKAL